MSRVVGSSRIMTSSVNVVVVVLLLLLLQIVCSSADVTISADGVPRARNRQPLFVQRGDVIQLRCTSSSPASSSSKAEDSSITWYRNGSPIDHLATTLTPFFSSLVARNVKQISRLTIQNASELDSGQYMCVKGHGETSEDNDLMNVLVVNGLQRPSQFQTIVAIVDPPDPMLLVRHGESFTLTCVIARRRRQLSNDKQQPASKDISGSRLSSMTTGSLQWLHNGVPLFDGSSSSVRRRTTSGDEVNADVTGGCRRVVITQAINVDTGWMTSLMMCMSPGARGTGVYECHDAEGVASDNVTVNVGPQPVNGRTVEIVLPTSRRHSVRPGSNVDIVCKADVSSALIWIYNGTTELETDFANGLQIIDRVDSVGGFRNSLLKLSSASESRTGQYTCRNQHDVTDRDSIAVLVGPEPTVVEHEDNEDSAPTMPSTIVMRVKSSVTVQCSVRARGELYAEWKKKEVVLQNSQKYVITSEDAVSSLTITATEQSDVGQYRCMFRHKDRRKAIVGVLTYDIVTLPCPALQAPTNGRLDLCPEPRVFGATCTFQCNPGYQLNEPINRTVCEKRATDGNTYWTHNSPGCVRSNREIPSTLSYVSFRVGTTFQLRCAEFAMSWTKDGVLLRNGSKYSMQNNMLTIKDTARSDAGLYICDIQRDEVLVGRNKFNVSTISCPPVVASPGVQIERCSKTPVYGDTCTFRCAPGRTLSAGTRVRLCDIKNNDSTYWTGEPPICSVLRSPGSGSSSLLASSPSSSSSSASSSPAVVIGSNIPGALILLTLALLIPASVLS